MKRKLGLIGVLYAAILAAIAGYFSARRSFPAAAASRSSPSAF